MNVTIQFTLAITKEWGTGEQQFAPEGGPALRCDRSCQKSREITRVPAKYNRIRGTPRRVALDLIKLRETDAIFIIEIHTISLDTAIIE